MSTLIKTDAKEKMLKAVFLLLSPLKWMFAKRESVCEPSKNNMRKVMVAILCTTMIFTMLPVMSLTAFASNSTPLTFTAEEDNSSVTLKFYRGTDVMYKLGNSNWADYTEGTAVFLNRNDTVSFKGIGVTTNIDDHFFLTGKIAASGDVTSLTNGVGGDATLTDYCYQGMFYKCESLTAAPELPSTTMANGCYCDLFSFCTSLAAAPDLPATTLADYCYSFMFSFCTSLNTVPELPATTLADGCYGYMFYGCNSLKVSSIKTGDYTKEWRIPSTGTITATAINMNTDMLIGTGGTFNTVPEVNTVYYIYVDRTPPVISGIENGKTYCETAVFNVTDENLDTVKVNGNNVNEVNGNYTLTSYGTNAIVATDKMGNEATATVTVYAEHAWDEGKITTEPSTTDKGVKTYTCSVCGETKTEGIPMLAPSIIEGENASYTEGGKDGLTFISNAALVDFKSVSVDGNVIGKTNYTTAEGTTVVTLTANYLATLSVGKHTLSIKSTGGTASTEFTVAAKADDPKKPSDNPTQGDSKVPVESTAPVISTTPVGNTSSGDTQSPQTGDTSNIALWLSLLIISGAMLITLGITIKRKNNTVK